MQREPPAEALVRGSVWLVFAGFESRSDAPDT